MVMDILRTIGIFFLYLVANPILYMGIIIIYFLSKRRVKEERSSFHTRVFGRVADLTVPFIPALLIGIYVSIFTIALGVVISLEWLGILTVFYIVLALTLRFRWVTPTYVLGLLLLFYGAWPFLANVEMLVPIYEELSRISLVAISSLLVLFILAEGLLIRLNGARYTSPRLKRSKRGKWIGLHIAKRLWVVPIVLFVPEGILPSLSVWPVFTIAEISLQPVLIPFLIGFHQQVRGSIPSLPIKTTGIRVMALGGLLAMFAIGSYYVPILAVVLGGLAIVGREWLTIQAKNQDEKRSASFRTQAKGCVILGVLPGSPAEKMNLAIGETIAKVNGQEVNSETTFYEALQINSAFCKLDVLDHDGEVRFAKGALYDGGHHQLGVLLVKDDVVLQDSIT